MRLLQTRPPEQVVGILLFSFHLIHPKVMDSRGRSERERCEKSGPCVKFTRFEGAPFLVYALSKIYELLFVNVFL